MRRLDKGAWYEFGRRETMFLYDRPFDAVWGRCRRCGARDLLIKMDGKFQPIPGKCDACGYGGEGWWEQ